MRGTTVIWISCSKNIAIQMITTMPPRPITTTNLTIRVAATRKERWSWPWPAPSICYPVDHSSSIACCCARIHTMLANGCVEPPSTRNFSRKRRRNADVLPAMPMQRLQQQRMLTIGGITLFRMRYWRWKRACPRCILDRPSMAIPPLSGWNWPSCTNPIHPPKQHPMTTTRKRTKLRTTAAVEVESRVRDQSIVASASIEPTASNPPMMPRKSGAPGWKWNSDTIVSTKPSA
mmetsp:Transcript_53717/g.64687  ORF Transcript_53717/g.64687 Transcript_53717/m.64687 type:complete len:233 (-) Transcript_53717:1691-2389(-)